MEDIFKVVDNITPLRNVKSVKVFENKLDHIPFFTIAIPTYKRAFLLKEALDSALNQEDFDDFDVIVCDNNPERNDETEILMKSYKDNPKITYYKHTQNVGMAGNWNKCALLSNSDKFVLLHDDDIIYPNALKTFKKILNRINGNWGLIHPSHQKFSNFNELRFRSIKKKRLVKHTLLDYLGGDCTGAPTITLFNKTEYIKVGGSDASWFPSIDYALSFHLYRSSGTYSTNVIIGGYRVGVNESLSKSTMDGYFIQKKLICGQMCRHYHLLPIIAKSILSYRAYEDYDWVRSFYNMPEYTFDFEAQQLYDKNNSIMKIVITCYKLCRRIIRKLSSSSF